MALLQTLTDDFSGTLAKWTVNAATIVGGELAVRCNHTAGAPTYAFATSVEGFTWSGSYLFAKVPGMPAVAGVSTANAQMWVMDSAPADTVARLGFEYRAAANALDCIGQSGATYAPIGTTTTLTYSATTHAWLRINHTGTAIVWQTSPDGVTWTTRRTLATVPTWANKTTLLASFQAFRSNGTNDTFRVDNVNAVPSAAVTLAVADEVEEAPAPGVAGLVVLDVAEEVDEAPNVVPYGTIPVPLVDEDEETPGVTAAGVVVLDVADEVEATFDPTIVWIATLPGVTESEESWQVQYPTLLPVADELELTDPPKVGDVFKRAYVPGFRSDKGMRVMAQRILPSLQWLEWEVPLADLSITKGLSRPQSITGNLRPHLPRVAELALRPWNTYLHVEDEAGLIRASAILAAPFGVQDDQRAVECVGVSTMPHQTVYEGAYAQYLVDPLVVIRHIWSHVQSFPDANLGVVVSQNTSPVRVGGYPPTDPALSGPRVDDSGGGTTEVKPYELNWWDQSNCGAEIDSLLSNVPLDYIEREAWNAAQSAVDHFVDLGYPRIGTRRTDLRFAQGENIIGAVPVAEIDDAYVTDVRITGAGEGSAMVLGQASRRGTQIRRVVQLNEKTIKATARAKAVADAELLRRAEPRGIDTLLIDAYHENAPYGSFQEGDDILVQCEVDWIGEVSMWHRVLEHTYTPGEGAVALKLRPSSTYRYGAAA